MCFAKVNFQNNIQIVLDKKDKNNPTATDKNSCNAKLKIKNRTILAGATSSILTFWTVQQY